MCHFVTLNNMDSPTAIQLAMRYRSDIKSKYQRLNKNKEELIDWFLASFWEDLPQSQLERGIIGTAINRALDESNKN